jgi:DNA-binding beta-propeller fold protein YncE
MTRVEHGIVYDVARDEIFVSAPLASAIVVFPGGASREVAPLRVIQGPNTRIHDPWELAVDDVHHELAVADFAQSAVLVFPIDANGNVAPRRIIAGPNTAMRGVSGVAVDPEKNLIFAMCFARGQVVEEGAKPRRGGILIFRRTDNGDVKPLRMIAGPRTGILSGWHVAVYGGKIFATMANLDYQPPYESSGHMPRKGCTGPPLPPLTADNNPGFAAVWNETDNGDVPPRAILRGPGTDLITPAGIVLNPKDGEIYVTDGIRNAVYSFLVPQFF